MMKRYMNDGLMVVKIMCADFSAIRVYAQIDAEGDYLVGKPRATDARILRGDHDKESDDDDFPGGDDATEQNEERRRERRERRRSESRGSVHANPRLSQVGMSFAGNARREARASRAMSDISLADAVAAADTAAQRKGRRGFSPFRARPRSA